MKFVYQLTLIIFLVSAFTCALAQNMDVSGTITTEKGEPLRGATVFIGATKRIMPTNETGQFIFHNVPAGAYQLSVQMVGYNSITQNLIVKNRPVEIDLQMHPKVTSLMEVTIGNKKASAKNLKLFEEKFLGQSANGKQCIIINPQIINFSTKKGLLMADADDFLIIENKRLGYRLHYMLSGFYYNNITKVVNYHGECSFEELDGTDNQKAQWTINRLDTYRGSLTHFLRSVYTNSTVENGFITRSSSGYVQFKYDTLSMPLIDYVVAKDKQVVFDSLVTQIDTTFASFKFKRQLYIDYNPRAAKHYHADRFRFERSFKVEGRASILHLMKDRAIIDKKGGYTDYRDFSSDGYWAEARVGDQLPIEYQPPESEIQGKTTATDPILALLQKWNDSIPQEKAYLHMDKPYYATGDTIWFKGYLTTGSRHRLSHLSGTAYVDFISKENRVITTLKLPVDSGTIAGNLILGEGIKAGSYRLRAYTQWMRNSGEEYFFDHSFVIGDPKAFKEQADTVASLQQSDVQFFPEGGNLINNLTSRVAFKAVAPNGLGTPISGSIVDNDNNLASAFNTVHVGMGSFLFRPLPGKIYTANIKFADGSSKQVILPAALNEGYVLSVYQPNQDSVLVRILASVGLRHSKIKLIIHNGGEIIFSSLIEINDAMTSIWLDKKAFPTGISQFTIFDSNNQPLNERIAFIKNHDYMQLNVKAAKAIYKSREHVQLQLNATGSDGVPVGANFSVAVMDESKVPVDKDAESTIFSNILLTSDIKGYVEKPNYYFNADTEEINKALDNLMLTQGYRRFKWESLVKTVSSKPTFAPEGLGYVISGTVTNLQHRVLPNVNLLLVSTTARINKVTTTDANGRFKFANLIFADSTKFAIQSRTKENSNNTIIILDSIPKVGIIASLSTPEASIIKANIEKAEQDGKHLNLTGHILKQIDIKATQQHKEDKTIVAQGIFSLPNEQSADRVIVPRDPQSFPTLGGYLQATIGGIEVKDESIIDVRTQSPLNIILNGRKTDYEEIKNVQVEDIAKILVVRQNKAMVNFLGGATDNSGGFLLFVMKSPAQRRQYDPDIVNVTLKGFNKVRQFYSPRYDYPAYANNLPDLRTTIYWNPYINTNTDGKATLDFFNADGPGDYRVVIEGIDAAGELGRQVYNLKVAPF